MPDPTPEEEFVGWLQGRLRPRGPSADPATGDPGEAFATLLRASLVDENPEPTTESETP